MSTSPASLRKLGGNGPSVPALGFGLMGMSGLYGSAPSDEERFKVLDRAVDIGATFWDTANIYGDNETVLGKWFKRTGKRNEIFLASKFGIVMEGTLKFKGIDSSAEYCKKCCNESLEKLGVGSIDIYYVHRINADTPIEETMRAMVELQKEGKIKHIGLSEASSNTLRRACKIAPVAANQLEYSPFDRDIENEAGTNVLATCRELGVAVVCYSPLGRGLLTGAFTSRESVSGEGDYRGMMFPRFSEENIDANLKIVNQFKAFADKKGCTSSQLALAWLSKQGDDIIPIPGTKKIKYLEENWNSLNVHLSDAEEAEIRKFVEGAEIQGYRSTGAGKTHAYVDTMKEV